jgi:kumamolisin
MTGTHRPKALRRSLLVLTAAAAVILALMPHTGRTPETTPDIDGPLAWLLASSADLGPAGDHAQLTVALRDSTRPQALIKWAADRRLTVQWKPQQDWAVLDGAAADLAGAFNAPIHSYRGRRGQVFYASARQPSVPQTLIAEVSGLGRILGYSPHHLAAPIKPAQDVPPLGLAPDALLRTYNATPLAAAGVTGSNQTIVFFEFDGYAQTDLDSYTAMSGLPPISPTLIGGQPGEPNGETVMDLEIAHAIAPAARLVVVNAFPTVEGGGTFPKIADLMESVDRQFPGAVWSLSIGWGCDRLYTAADLAPVRSALTTAETHGTSAFDASGDRGGLECKGDQDWSTPPAASDVGLDSVASLPEMTDVGGTTLSTDATGKWLDEQAWSDFPLSQGTSGGISALFPRPQWQSTVYSETGPAHRLTPDVAAVADSFTGVKIVFNHQVMSGGGTSQSAPIWAGLAALMNQWLIGHGGHALGSVNPLLYRVAAGAARPAYHDIVLGGNAVNAAGPGFDLVSGLGTPDTDNLVHDLLDLQAGST